MISKYFEAHIKVSMDQHDLKASGMAKRTNHLGEANSLSDCFGTCTDGNAGLQKQDHESDHETSGCRADKLPETERNYLTSSTDCTAENMDVLRQSPVISTMKESILRKEHCAEAASAVISCCNGLEGQGNPKQGEVSALSPEGNASTKNISMKSDISSDSGQRLDKENNELVDGRITGYWSNAGESGLKSVMQASFHDKPYKTESSSSNSTHITLPASSNDSCQVTSVDVKACTNSKTSAMDTSTCTDFKSNLEEPAVRILAVGMASQASKDVLDSTIFHPGKQQNAFKVSEIVNVRSKDSYRVLGMISDHNSLTVEDIDLQNPNLFKKKVTEDSNHDKAQPCYVLDDALEVARRVAREVEREVGTYREVSGSSSSVHEKNDEAVRMSSVDSADSNKRDCLTETGSEIRFCSEQDNSDSFCSIKEVVDLETSARNEGLYLEVKQPSHGMDPSMMNVSNDCLHHQESSYVTPKPEDVAASDQATHIFGFDLNENILANEDGYPEHSVYETISYHAKTVIKPVPVLAKSRIPFSLPTVQSKCEEEVGGWRRSAASAFRQISLPKSCNRNKSSSPNDNYDCSKQSQVKGIDLNVAAAGVDFDMELLPDKCVQEQSSLASEESSMEVSSRRARMFHIDLNFASENDDGYRQLSPPASLSGYSVRDFDLNDNPISVDASIDAHQPGQGTQALRNVALDDDPAVSFMGIAKQPDSRNVGTGYLTGFSSFHGFPHGNAKSLQVAASNVLPSNEQIQMIHPLHHKLTYTAPPPAPSHAFLYNNGFCIDPNSHSSTVYPPSFLPYITDPRGTTVIPQVLGPGAPHIMSVPGGMGALSAFSGGQHMMSFPGGSCPSDIAFMRPSFDLNGIAATSENGSRVDNARPLFLPVSNSTLEEPVKSFQQVAFPATSMKRREPDGGWDSHQLSHRQVTSWQ